MKEITIRSANIDDANSILDINVESWKQTYKGIFPEDYLNNLCKNDEEYLYSLNKIIKKITEQKNYSVAVVDNKVVGFVHFGKTKKEQYLNCGEIYALYIRNDLLKKGIGTKLFKNAIELLHETYPMVIVSCLKNNSSNEFYKKVGCKKIGECDFYLNDAIYKENIYEC